MRIKYFAKDLDEYPCFLWPVVTQVDSQCDSCYIAHYDDHYNIKDFLSVDVEGCHILIEAQEEHRHMMNVNETAYFAFAESSDKLTVGIYEAVSEYLRKITQNTDYFDSLHLGKKYEIAKFIKDECLMKRIVLLAEKSSNPRHIFWAQNIKKHLSAKKITSSLLYTKVLLR